MRIISGSYRGKKLRAPENLPVRPTTDFAKTGLFNILSARFDFEKVNVLDLYSGTGSITYEFFSRGCIHIISVERNRECIQFIRTTLEKLRAPSSVKVVQADALSWLGNSNEKFDIIFADPPFDETPADLLLAEVFDNTLLKKEGYFILEHLTGISLSHLPFFVETRKYGNVSFSFFKSD